MKRSLKIEIAVGILIVGAAIAWLVLHRASPIRPAEPQKTVQEILQERATQAGKHLESPLGQAFATKDWAKFKELYKPATQFSEFAEILRAAFIQNNFQSFSSDDNENVLAIAVDTIDQLSAKTEALSGLLITQFFRLPPADQKLPTFQKLVAWAEGKDGADDFKKRNAILKIVLEDANPPTNIVQQFLAGILGDTYRIDRNEWLRKINDIRSVKVQTKGVEYLSQHYGKLEQANRPAALLVLSHHAEIETAALVKYTIDAYQKDSQEYFEAALRATKPLLDRKAFNDKQKAGVAKKIAAVPDTFLTPFVRAKIAEIQPLLK